MAQVFDRLNIASLQGFPKFSIECNQKDLRGFHNITQRLIQRHLAANKHEPHLSINESIMSFETTVATTTEAGLHFQDIRRVGKYLLLSYEKGLIINSTPL